MPVARNDCRPDVCNRRTMLRIGSLTAMGLGIAEWIRSRAKATDASKTRAKACILVWLDGGPSHLETVDPKPNAPVEVRGPFGVIGTNVSGVHIGELLPRTAKVMDRLAIIRSLTSPLGEHGLANHYLLTGYPPTPVLQYPSMGAVVSHARAGRPILPNYIAVPDYSPMAGAGFLGSAHQPFALGGDPAKPDFRVRDLEPFDHVTAARLERRRNYLSYFDAWQRSVEASEPSANPAFEQAFRLITSAEAKRAFDLSQEKSSVRADYGPRTLGQSCLLARRLIERGVPFVTVNNPGWDTHTDLVLRLQQGYAGAAEGVGLIPTLDQAFAAMIGDLATRGLLDETLVIAMGEFGRTPKLNTARGRDHWPRVFSAVLAGAGIPGGQVIGASDRVGESPAERPLTPADLVYSIYTLLNIDPTGELQTVEGRPVRINQSGQIIPELVA